MQKHASEENVDIHTLHNLGAFIKGQRTERSWTQQALAERSGVARLVITQIERGKTDARFTTVLAVLAALDADLRAVVREPEFDSDSGRSVLDEALDRLHRDD